MKIPDKIRVKRVPKRGIYDKETIYRILDTDFMCTVSFMHMGVPVGIPTIYGRKDNILYLHGAGTSRMLVELDKGVDLCVTMFNVHGLVLAKSAFHHSLNYESVVVFGVGKAVPDDQKMEALKVVSDQILANRWEESRLPNEKELKATTVIAIDISEASAKVRTGPPGDDKADEDLPIWSGVIPIQKQYMEPLPADDYSLKNKADSVKGF